MADFPIQFEHPQRLWGLLLTIPIVLLALRSLSGLGKWRQRLAIALRILTTAILVILLAEPQYARTFDHLSVIAVIDRSQSVPRDRQTAAAGYINTAGDHKPKTDRLGVVNTAETALIESLPAVKPYAVSEAPGLLGDRTDLAAAVRLAMAVLPSDTAKRIVVLSDGNENVGNLRDVAKIAKANRIPIDVVPLQYDHDREVILERLIVPHNARRGQTLALKAVLRSTRATGGSLLLEDNGRVLDLDPDSPGATMPIALKPGLNVTTIFLPVASGGTHRFRATFTGRRDDDTLTANNTASGVTFVASRGHVLVTDPDGLSAAQIMRTLTAANIDAEYRPAFQFPGQLLELMEFDSVVMVNTPASSLSLAQQEMITRYVHDLGGGLVMVGGPKAFGAGGWIGSPVEKALPVDLDPPQKQQMPKGALALIMHSCEMPQGNYWGERVAIAAVKSLSRLDLVGVIDYDWNAGGSMWVWPLQPAGDKTSAIAAIRKMQMGDMPDFGSGLQLAYNALTKSDAGQKHIIIISDGDPAPPSIALLKNLKAAGITVTGVAVFPHSPADVQTLKIIAQATSGRFYNVSDPNKLPQIFIKEAQTVRRPLIWEKPFLPRIINPLSELTKGVDLQPPKLDGFVLTGEKKELVELVMVTPENDPILASRQYGLGKTVAFTSDASSRWAGSWLGWPRFAPFWEQVVRWSMRSGESPNLQILTDLDGRRATVTVEATGENTAFAEFLDITGVAIDPDLQSQPVKLEQIGPGRYQAEFTVNRHGTHIINLRCREGDTTRMVRSALTVPFAAEFRDLKDNTALLAESATITGGRVLTADDDMFDHAAVQFPVTKKPLWRLFSILWLILFLIDVAVRRVVVDLRAAWKRLRQALAAFRKGQDTEQTVAALRERKQAVQKRFQRAADRRIARKRFEPSAGQTRAVDIITDAEPTSTDTAEPSPKPDAETTPLIDRLKQAKQKAKERMDDDTKHA